MKYLLQGFGTMIAVTAMYVYMTSNCMTFVPHRIVCSFPSFN